MSYTRNQEELYVHTISHSPQRRTETQENVRDELTEKTGINISTLRSYIRKKHPSKPSLTNAIKISQALNISMDRLATGVEYHYQ